MSSDHPDRLDHSDNPEHKDLLARRGCQDLLLLKRAMLLVYRAHRVRLERKVIEDIADFRDHQDLWDPKDVLGDPVLKEGLVPQETRDTTGVLVSLELLDFQGQLDPRANRDPRVFRESLEPRGLMATRALQAL